MSQPPSRVTWILLGVLVVGGGAVRLHDLDRRALGHVEAYTPGIPFPEGVAAPAPRTTLYRTLRGSVDEVHPPVWYLLTWPWTKLAGTSLFAMRLPSAVLGTLCIVLVFLAGAMTRDRASALVAAAILAGHGHHYFWSQMSRPSILGCALSLASTALLLRIARAERPRPAAVGAFLVLSLAGLGTSYYYWAVFGAQVLWVWGALATRREQLLGLFRWSATALVAATPLIGLAVYQSSDRDNYLATDAVAVLAELVGLCFPFHNAHLDPHQPLLPRAVIAALPVVIGAALAAGLSARKGPLGPARPGVGSPSAPVVAGAGLLAAAALAAAAWALAGVERLADRAAGVGLVAPVPVIATTLLLIELRGGWLSRLPGRITAVARPRGVALVTWLAVFPPAVVFAIDLAIPFLAPRHMLVFTPYVIVLVAIGLTRAVQSLRGTARAAVAITVGLLLVAVLAASIQYQYHRTASVTDYAGAAEEWVGELRAEDVVFMTRHWVNTPMLYYTLHLDRDYVWRDWEETIRHSPGARVWVVSYPGVPPRPEMLDALTGHELTRTIERKNVSVELWEAR